MKKLVSAFTVLAIVSSAFAFQPFFGDGSVYCNSSCTTASKIDFRVDETNLSTITDPCLNGVGGEYNKVSPTICQPVGSGTVFVSTHLGK